MIGALLACAAGVICHGWDLFISQAIEKIKMPGDLRKAVGLSESFAHSSGCIVIFACLLWIDLRNRKLLWRAALFTLLCGIVSNLTKMMIPRIRPHAIDQSEYEIVSSWQTWGVPWSGTWSEEQFRSFPSGHSATAVAFAIGLSQVYPRGKWFFAAIAASACFQRLESQAHYLSDIMGGVAITLLLSVWYWKDSNARKEKSPGESILHPPLLTTE